MSSDEFSSIQLAQQCTNAQKGDKKRCKCWHEDDPPERKKYLENEAIKQIRVFKLNNSRHTRSSTRYIETKSRNETSYRRNISRNSPVKRASSRRQQRKRKSLKLGGPVHQILDVLDETCEDEDETSCKADADQVGSQTGSVLSHMKKESGLTIPTIGKKRLEVLSPTYGHNIGFQKTGLKNLGNSCYISAVIQCLVATEGLIDALRKKLQKNVSYQSDQLSCELIFLSMVLNSGEYRAVRPTDFKTAVDKSLPSFRGSRQHDSHEFLVKLLDIIEEEAPNTISNIFDGEITNKLICSECKNQSIKKDPFRFLPIDIQAFGGTKASVQTCLDNFLEKKETVDYYCENAGCYSTKAVKSIHISKEPQVLIVQAKRFAFSPSNNLGHLHTYKICDPVEIEHTVKISADGIEGHQRYNLYSVTSHKGSLGMGHYTAQCRDPLVENSWIMYDDSNTYSDAVFREKDAYLLFYQKALDTCETEARLHQLPETHTEKNLTEAVTSVTVSENFPQNKVSVCTEERESCNREERVANEPPASNLVKNLAPDQENENLRRSSRTPRETPKMKENKEREATKSKKNQSLLILERGEGIEDQIECDKENSSKEKADGSWDCPLCKTPYDETKPMLSCATCYGWFHGECIDFTCQECAQTSTEETNELVQLKERFNTMVKEQDKVKKNLRDTISARDKELSKKTKMIENWGDDRTKACNEAKVLRNENLELKEEVQNSRSKIKELEAQVNKLRRNLDSSNSQFTKVRKEKNESLKELTKKETLISSQETEIDRLKAENTDLKRQVKVHETFVQKEFGGEDHLQMSKQIEEARAEIKKKEAENQTMAEKIQSLTEEMEKGESTKLKDKKEEVKKLQQHVTVLEESNRDKENENSKNKERTLTLEKELTLEKDINLLIKEKMVQDGIDRLSGNEEDKRDESRNVRKIKKHQGGERQYCGDVFLNATRECSIEDCQKDHERNKNKIKRGVCIQEFDERKSCRRESCMFSHRFPASLNDNKEFRKKIEDRKKMIGEKKKKRMEQQTDSEIKSSKHYQTYKICVYEFEKQGSCRYKDDCFYEHNFPEVLRSCAQTKNEVDAKRAEMKEKRRTRMPNRIELNDNVYGNEKKRDYRRTDESNLGKTINKAVDNFLYSLRSLIQDQVKSSKWKPSRIEA